MNNFNRIKTLKNRKNNWGFSSIEILLVVMAIAGVVLYCAPTMSKIKAATKEANRFKAICLVESSKNKFDQDSKIADKRSFDSSDDNQRFNKLEPILGVTDPLVFFKDTGIVRIKVNKLGTDVETTTQEDIKN